MADSRRPRLALPFTVLASPGVVRIVAGEDFRYTLKGDGIDGWLPALLASFDGRRPLGELSAAAAEVVDRLYGERVLVDGDARPTESLGLGAEGRGPLLDGLPTDGPLRVLCQDRLDYDEALRFNRRCLEGPGPWMWATIGPLARGYVSPVFLPGSGPCLACLLRHFRRRSPAPELYDALEEQGKKGLPIEPATFPPEGVAILHNLMVRKAAMLSDAAAYRLHVLETATLEVTSHRVFRDPECDVCGGLRR
jgi:bacteriocin biosynthesis cyclodehydratase domain-containing protein